jgi:trehalose utilization protein
MPSIAKEVADKTPLDHKDMWNSSLSAPEPNEFVVLGNSWKQFHLWLKSSFVHSQNLPLDPF